MKYFNNIKTIDELKLEYKKLARKLHPDCGGSNEEMKILNKEYEIIFEKVKNIRRNTDGTTYEKANTENSNEYTCIINKIISCNCDIEVAGSWIWCFNAYTCKDVLKSVGFKWANKKKAWYWHSAAETSKNKKALTMEAIRSKYGSKVIRSYEPIKALTN